MLQKRRVRRAKIRAASHFDLGVGKRLHRAAQITRRRRGIVIQKINELAAGGAHGGVALDGGLLAARDDDLQLVVGIIKLFAGGDGLDVRLAGPGGNQNSHTRQGFVHGG